MRMLAFWLALGIFLAGAPGSPAAGPRNPTLEEYASILVIKRLSRLDHKAWSMEYAAWEQGMFDVLREVSAFGEKDRQPSDVLCFNGPVNFARNVPQQLKVLIEGAFKSGQWQQVRKWKVSEAVFHVYLRNSPCRRPGDGQ